MARVLIVDDTPVVLDVMQRALARAGHDVVTAATGAAALHFADMSPFDAVVVDYDMPDLDGLQVLGRVRELQPGCAAVLVSGNLDLPVTMEAVNRTDVTRVLAKPFAGTALLEAVDDSLAVQRRWVEKYLVDRSREEERDGRDLHNCFDDQLFWLALQPIICAKTECIVGHEALLRSTHPRLNSPATVLAAAERYQMVDQLGARVAELAEEVFPCLSQRQVLFLNLHPQQLLDAQCLRRSLAPLAGHPDRIVLEITERCAIGDLACWEPAVVQLSAAGFALALDDLGAGYSSLSLMAELRPSYIKVDRSLISGIQLQPHKQRLLQLICQFAETVDAKVVAEGIEQRDEAAASIACGTDLLQGYLFGRPQAPQR